LDGTGYQKQENHCREKPYAHAEKRIDFPSGALNGSKIQLSFSLFGFQKKWQDKFILPFLKHLRN
jgi:hypothetical protein